MDKRLKALELKICREETAHPESVVHLEDPHS
jgi:hypothetical protein